MEKIYGRWMLDWENRLCSRATNRVVRPFEWGLEWTRQWPHARAQPRNGHSEPEYLQVLNRAGFSASDEFFSYQPPRDFRLTQQAAGRMLRFTSAAESPYPENNQVHAQFFLP